MAVALQSNGETIGTVVDLYDGTGVLPVALEFSCSCCPCPRIYYHACMCCLLFSHLARGVWQGIANIHNRQACMLSSCRRHMRPCKLFLAPHQAICLRCCLLRKWPCSDAKGRVWLARRPA